MRGVVSVKKGLNILLSFCLCLVFQILSTQIGWVALAEETTTDENIETYTEETNNEELDLEESVEEIVDEELIEEEENSSEEIEEEPTMEEEETEDREDENEETIAEEDEVSSDEEVDEMLSEAEEEDILPVNESMEEFQAPEDGYIVVEDFEEGIEGWTATGTQFNHVDLSLATAPTDPVRFGNHSLRIDYDFEGTSGTSGVYANPPELIEVPGDPDALGLFIYGDGAAHWFRMKVVDGNGQWFNLDLTEAYPNGVTWEGWRYVEATISDSFEPPYQIEMPVRYMATVEDAKTAGTIYVDQVRAIYGEVEEDLTSPELDFFQPNWEEPAYTNTPEISVQAFDADSGVDPENILMSINGEEVEHTFDAETGRILHVPTTPLADGYHTARIEVYDYAGNSVTEEWSFMVDTGGALLNLQADESALAGSTFTVHLTLNQLSALREAQAHFSYDSELFNEPEITIEDEFNSSTVQAEVDSSEGEIFFRWENLDSFNYDGETTVASLSFDLSTDATGELILELISGELTYRDESIGRLPFFREPFVAPIEQPLQLDIEGISQGTESVLTVTDQENQPVEGAAINVLNDQLLIEVLEDTYIYEGGSGVAGEPSTPVEAGTYIPVANEPYDGFPYYRIFMPNGEQRYFHVPEADVELVDWGILFGTTDENGQIFTDVLTLSEITVHLQAHLDELVSQVYPLTITPTWGGETPDNINLTWVNDPKTTQHVTWRTSPNTQLNSVLEVVPAEDAQTFDSEHVLQFEGESHLVADENGEMRIHHAEAVGLEPGTTYDYRVGDGSEEGWSDIYSFETEPEEDEPFTFLFAADTQAETLEQFALWTELYETGLAHHPDSRFVVHAGDIIDNGQLVQEWNYYLEASQGISPYLPTQAVLGNHDVYGNAEETFLSLFPYAQNGPEGKEGWVYSFDYGNARFLKLNSEFGIQDMQEQQEWIREEVRSAGDKFVIAMFHRSPYSSNPLTGRDTTADTFSPVLEEEGVDLVLTGHDHAYMRTHLMQDGEVVEQPEGNSGTQYVIGGSAGPKFYPGEYYSYVDFLYDEDIQVISALTVDGDEIRGEALTIDGEVIDQYVVTRNDRTVDEDPIEEEPVEVADPQIDPITDEDTTITGTAGDDRLAIVLYVDGEELGRVEPEEFNSPFSYELEEPLTAGSTLTAHHIDEEGNLSEGVQVVVEEATREEETDQEEEETEQDEDEVSAPEVDEEENEREVISGTVEDPELPVVIEINGEQIVTQPNPDGSFRVELDSPLPEGSTVTIYQLTEEGTPGEKTEYTVEQGERLPQTATRMWILALSGGILLVLGLFLQVIKRKEKVI